MATECNCPSIYDWRPVYTKPPCSVHQMPPGLADKLLPAIPVSDLRISLDPVEVVDGD